MGQSELLIYLCNHLGALGVRYLITGSQATIAFGEPRFTVDIDVVVELKPSQVDAFIGGFPEEEFYLSRAAVQQAIDEAGMFNVIHPASGLKIDVMIPDHSEFDQTRLNRGVRISLTESCEAVFTSPEDIILKKMEWHQLGGGERHLMDIAGVIRVQGERLDQDYIAEQVDNLNLQEVWLSIRNRYLTEPE